MTLLSPEDEFVYPPIAVAQPFGRGHADGQPLADSAADVRAQLIRSVLVEVDPASCTAVASTGQRLS